MQSGSHGLDLSAQASTLLLASAIKLNASCLYYFTPNLDSEYYLGGGMAFYGMHVYSMNLFGGCSSHEFGAGVSPQLVFGNQYLTKKNSPRFLQIEVAGPTYGEFTHEKLPGWWYYPTMTFSYGIGF